MSLNPRYPTTFKVYKCLKCPNGRGFDMLQISATGKNAQRSLEHHVGKAHPEHHGDFRDLMEETITRQRGSRGQSRQTSQDISAARPERNTTTTLASSLSSSSSSRFEPTPSSVLEPASQLSSHTQLPDPNDPSYKSHLTRQASIARAKAATIQQELEDGETATISLDKWDFAALNGILGEDMQALASAAFPPDMFDDDFTICFTVDEDVLNNSFKFYTVKAAKFEAKAAGQEDFSE